jgi:hypothetical protein
MQKINIPRLSHAMGESFFVAKCRGCGELYSELATDDMMRRRFRLAEANKAPPNGRCHDFIDDHVNKCPEYARKHAKYLAKKEQKKMEALKAAQKPKQKPVPAALAKQDRDAVDKHRRSKIQSGEAVAPTSSVKNGDRLVDILADQPGQQDAIFGPPLDRDTATADAAPQLPPLGSTENGTASRDDEVKKSVKDFLRQYLYSAAMRMRRPGQT